jgi:hypothetical protein
MKVKLTPEQKTHKVLQELFQDLAFCSIYSFSEQRAYPEKK